MTRNTEQMHHRDVDGIDFWSSSDEEVSSVQQTAPAAASKKKRPRPQATTAPAANAATATSPTAGVSDDFFIGHLLAWTASPASAVLDALALSTDSPHIEEVRRLNREKHNAITAAKAASHAAANAHVRLRIPYKQTAFKLTYQFQTPLTSAKAIVNATRARFSALATKQNPIVVESVIDVRTGEPLTCEARSFLDPSVVYTPGAHLYGRRVVFFLAEDAVKTFELHEHEGKHVFELDEFPYDDAVGGLRLRYCSNGAFESMIERHSGETYTKYVNFSRKETDAKRVKRAYEMEHDDRVNKQTYSADGAIARMIARRERGELDEHFFEKIAHGIAEWEAMEIVTRMIKYGAK